MKEKAYKSIRVPFSRETRRSFENQAQMLGMSNSAFARMLISRELKERKPEDFRIKLNVAHTISYETYVQTYLPETLVSKIAEMVGSTDYDKSKLAWYLVMKGMKQL